MYTRNHCLVFSHNENSSGYQGCDTKYGDISSMRNMYPYSGMPGISRPWAGARNEITSVNVENKIKPVDMGHWFYGMSNIASLNLNNIDVSNCEDLQNIFGQCGSLNSINISNWNTSKVEKYDYMFKGCSSLSNVAYGNKFVKKESASTTDLFGEAYGERDNFYELCPSWYGEQITINFPPSSNTYSDYYELMPNCHTFICKAQNQSAYYVFYDENKNEVGRSEYTNNTCFQINESNIKYVRVANTYGTHTIAASISNSN